MEKGNFSKISPFDSPVINEIICKRDSSLSDEKVEKIPWNFCFERLFHQHFPLLELFMIRHKFSEKAEISDVDWEN